MDQKTPHGEDVGDVWVDCKSCRIPAGCFKDINIFLSPCGRGQTFKQIKTLIKTKKREGAMRLTASYDVVAVAPCAIGRRTDRQSKGRSQRAGNGPEQKQPVGLRREADPFSGERTVFPTHGELGQ